MAKEKEEKEGLKSYIISFIFSSLCSLALPVALSFYFAPEKSWAYFQSTIQGKVDYVGSIEWDNIYAFVLSILDEVPPMLKTEYDVLMVITENVPPALQTAATHVIYLDYYITLTLVLAIAIAGYFFPFQETKDWIMNVLWGSVCVVSGFLPLDEGMDVLADKEAGVYKMAVMLTAVVLTLLANYLVVVVSWWIISKLLSLLWRGIRSKFGRKQKQVKGKIVVNDKKKGSKQDKQKKHDNYKAAEDEAPTHVGEDGATEVQQPAVEDIVNEETPIVEDVVNEEPPIVDHATSNPVSVQD